MASGGLFVKGWIVVGGFDLSLMELDVVGESLGLDVRPFPFTDVVPVHGRSVAERRRVVDEAADSLAARGLLDGSGFVAEVEQLVSVFALGAVSVAMVGVDRCSHCVRAVVDGAVGVLAARHDGLVRFTPISLESVPRAVLAGLAVLGPGPGSSVSVTEPDSSARAGAREEWEDDDCEAPSTVMETLGGGRGLQWRLVEQIVHRPRLGGGYVTVSTHEQAPGRVSEPLSMTWIDTDVGRYAILPSRASDGRVHVTYLPADARRLEQGLTDLLTTASNMASNETSARANISERLAVGARRSGVEVFGGSRRNRGV